MSDPSIWPDLTFGDIYFYLVAAPSFYFTETMKSFKSLDACRMKEKPHNPWVCLRKKEVTYNPVCTLHLHCWVINCCFMLYN
ncbi:hypothetical protein ACJMK2_021600 [Sinanodonta woodiana]|uniref:Uncharacterized protein n=1 Tax=Sinanodonta woodiana TaxID=1069815 RepID=A0ABD3TGJ5_SINWO